MTPDKKSTPSESKNISINGDVVDSTVIIGDNNTVNQTIIQKFFNIFKSDSETLEQRNRRILLGHVENAWIKGVLDASLHGAALLDLGIKPDPEAVTKYPWAIKKESTDENLPAGTSMLEIFDSIGMGRSLLILGAPGSGKTTMLLELARQLIERAREDVTQPIPMVFNLASWTEKLALADWLAQELNNLYSVPRKTAPDWVKGNKLLLLLDGLDEVRQESRAKCVKAINSFRKEHGLTSLAVCSRSQDYADLNAKLSFEGAIEVQLLTQKQTREFLSRFGDEMAGIKQALEKDSALREMGETPLFLSIMIMAYRDKRGLEILTSKDKQIQRKHLFNHYIERMFEHARSSRLIRNKHNILHSLSWLARNMIDHNTVPYLYEDMQSFWLPRKAQGFSNFITGFASGLFSGIMGYFSAWIVTTLIFNMITNLGAITNSSHIHAGFNYGMMGGLIGGMIFGPLGGFIGGLIFGFLGGVVNGIILGWLGGFIGFLIGGLSGGFFRIKKMSPPLKWNWKKGLSLGTGIGIGVGISMVIMLGIVGDFTSGIGNGKTFGIIFGIVSGLIGGFEGTLVKIRMVDRINWSWKRGIPGGLVAGFSIGLCVGIIDWLLFWDWASGMTLGFLFVVSITPMFMLMTGLNEKQSVQTISPGQKINTSIKNFFFILFSVIALVTVFNGVILNIGAGFYYMLLGISIGPIVSLGFGGFALIQHFTLRLSIFINNLLPWKLVPFLDHCVDLIFLRRVGGGYIFVHRLLMEHFAEMYVESPMSKGN